VPVQQRKGKVFLYAKDGLIRERGVGNQNRRVSREDLTLRHFPSKDPVLEGDLLSKRRTGREEEDLDQGKLKP